MATTDIEQLSIDTIRTLSMDAVQKANSGHPGTPMALAPLAYLLYPRILRHNPPNPHWPDRDRFVLSAGHASHAPVLDAAPHRLRPLARGPQALPPVGLDDAGPPRVPPHRRASRSRPARSARASRTASAWRSPSASCAGTFNRPHQTIVDHHIFAICSDGDLMEGIASEAASLAGPPRPRPARLPLRRQRHHDRRPDRASRFTRGRAPSASRRYGWHVQTRRRRQRPRRAASRDRRGAGDGRAPVADPRALASSATRRRTSPAPRARTAPRSARTRCARRRRRWAGIPTSTSSCPTSVVRAHERASRAARRCEAEWTAALRGVGRGEPELADEWDAAWAGEPRPGCARRSPEFAPGDEIATRDAGKTVMQAFGPFVPTMIGGAADLVDSTNTEFTGRAESTPRARPGRNIAFGVREHAMGAIVNGIALHGGIVRRTARRSSSSPTTCARRSGSRRS